VLSPGTLLGAAEVGVLAAVGAARQAAHPNPQGSVTLKQHCGSETINFGSESDFSCCFGSGSFPHLVREIFARFFVHEVEIYLIKHIIGKNL